MARRNLFLIIIHICLLWLLSACQSTVESALSLTLSVEGNRPLPPLRIQVTDMRPQNHLVQIHQGRQPAEFATSARPLGSLISDALSRTLNIQPESPQTLHLKVDRALCEVQQSLTRHEAICEVILIAQSEGPRGELTKTFSRRRTREGQLAVSLTDLEGDLSDLFSATINSALNDSGMEQWLNSQAEILQNQTR